MLGLVADDGRRRRHPGSQSQQDGGREIPEQHRKPLEARPLRRRPRFANAPDAHAPGAGRTRQQCRIAVTGKPPDPGAHPGARWNPVGQIPVGRRSHRQIAADRPGGPLPGLRTERPGRSGLGAARRTAPQPPALALVDSRNRGHRNRIAAVVDHPDPGRRPRRLADLHAGPPSGMGERVGDRSGPRHGRRGRRVRAPPWCWSAPRSD